MHGSCSTKNGLLTIWLTKIRTISHVKSAYISIKRYLCGLRGNLTTAFKRLIFYWQNQFNDIINIRIIHQNSRAVDTNFPLNTLFTRLYGLCIRKSRIYLPNERAVTWILFPGYANALNYLKGLASHAGTGCLSYLKINNRLRYRISLHIGFRNAGTINKHSHRYHRHYWYHRHQWYYHHPQTLILLPLTLIWAPIKQGTG
ncbi:hypothetical protein PpBr36_02277 [Pyricularia pennisetigena]|uniref:hypothetical protein n=1 Tax=Pyricularia pennisetigena TaxID=1578925 RepID=UPI001154F486|nr:hypothetical protein PpBr36_02277 [Pyricularia pennisetigena]TLS30894.1 hypothetical protein PpBr36_02277 [Pyricularia pennisetigena]